MQSREAKDIIVQETAKQATLEGVPFSELERRMMYFTEDEEMSEDPLKLNNDFEAEYDSEEYEAKISALMHHAYARIKKENPEAERLWNEAIRELHRGDHYVLVLWGEGLAGKSAASKRPPYDSLKLFGAGLLVAALGVGSIFVADLIAGRYGLHWPKGGTETHSPLPTWLQRGLFGLVLCGYVYYVALPWILKRRLPGIGQLFL